MARSSLPSVLTALGANAASAESDADLLSRYVAERDDAAFTTLVRRYARLVWRVARTRCRSDATAEDVFQAAFVVMSRKAKSIRSGGALPGWLHRTTHRLAVKAARGERPTSPLPADTPVSADPLDALSARELLAAVDDEMARLSDAERSALVLCGVEAQSVDEAAGRLGWTPASVKGRLRRARAKLHTRLAARGLTLPAVVLGLIGGPMATTTQAAVRATTGGPVRPAVTRLIAEGLKMRHAITTAAVVVTLLGGLILAGGWGGGSSPNPRATAAPVPKGEPVEDGLIWTYHSGSGELTAYTPAGEKAKTLKLKDGRRLLAITPDGSKLAFLGKGGRLTATDDDKNKPGLSIHLRDIGEGPEGVDTGIAYTPRDQFVWSPDGKQVVRVGFRSKKPPFKLGTLASDMTHSLVDVETKKETPLLLGHDQEQVMGWSPDGTWLLTKQFTRIVGRGDAQYFLTENHRHDLATSASTPLGAKVQLANLSFSPDGRSMVGTSIESPGLVAGQKGRHVVRVDVATGESTEIARHEDQFYSHTRWAPSGKRVAYLWHKQSDKNEAFLSIIDPDGKNPKTVTIPTPDDTANELGILGWFPDKPVAKPPTAEKPKAGKKSDEPKKDEPAWKAAFNKAYGLKDGELVKRVAPPYPDCRTDYFRSVLEWHRKRPPTDAELDFEVNNFTVFNWKDNALSAGWQTHTEPEQGVSLQFVLGTVLELHTTRIRDDANVLNQKITGDFVVRTGADREKMAAQLEAILRKELDLPVKFSFTEEEEDVFVLSGKYAAKPLDGRKADEIEVYAVRLIDRTVGGGGGGEFKGMVDAIERHTGRPILLEKADGLPKSVRWHFNFSNPLNKQMEAQERDAATLLDNLAAQTGLTVKEEKRKVRKLVIEQAELKK